MMKVSFKEPGWHLLSAADYCFIVNVSLFRPEADGSARKYCRVTWLFKIILVHFLIQICYFTKNAGLESIPEVSHTLKDIDTH